LPTVDQAVAKAREAKQERVMAPAPQPTASRPEKELDATEVSIRQAFGMARNADELRRQLEDQGIYLAAVTKPEAERSQFQHAMAKGKDPAYPAYREGELVAVNLAGQVYSLDSRTTGQAEVDLASLDHKGLRGIEATQHEIHLRAQQFIALTAAGARPPQPSQIPAPDAGNAEAPEKKTDWLRFLTDPEYRRQAAQQDRPPIQPEPGRGGRDRT
jgi:hypothetical protein